MIKFSSYKKKNPLKTSKTNKEKPSLNKYVENILGITGILLALIGIIIGALAIIPRVNVDASSEAFDSLHTSPAIFTITNNSVYPLEDVEARVGLCQLQYDIGIECPGALETSFSRTKLWQHRKLRVDERFTIALEDLFILEAPQATADISIIVKYKVWFFPWNRQEEFKFYTRKLLDGKLYWFSKSLDD